ncbi:MAG TPA: CinA family nicotinamide mononucleotide deamidase-related protein [Puia sp.]|jgi:nicotinamide-nucleotide amidase|nr:CinA family nicotinamide mononucleotide deamidase-related protein [Puia sp.]
MEKIIASIITIGDELLIGQVVDTNSAWMGRELNKNGIWVAHRIAVGDVREDIWQALDEEFRRSQIILITGGLGPTADDITKPLLCEYFGGRLVVDPGALDNVKKIFARLQRPMIDRNLQQAEVPDTCTVIPNRRGTAPGMWFEKEGRIFVSMPGVPHEMKGMMTDSIIPNLSQRFRLPFIAHRTLLTAGIGESFLADHLAAFETALPAAIKMAYLPNYGMVRLRLTIHGEDPTALNALLQENFDTLKGLVAEWMVADEDISVEEAIGRMLKSRGRTLGTAESCTGGYIAHLITSIPGSSHYFKGSIVSYANEVKTKLLHVAPDILASDGAVSQATVEAMVRGALTQLDTDYVIATSGIMGPDGGTPEKPVGTVWIAVGNHQNILAQKFSFRFDRERNIELTATNALNQLRKFILSAG